MGHPTPLQGTGMEIDLWGYNDTDYQKHIAEFETLRSQLQHADRDAILRIKHVICQHPDYRGTSTIAWQSIELSLRIMLNL